jgi:hypothetical protein
MNRLNQESQVQAVVFEIQRILATCRGYVDDYSNKGFTL